MISNMPLPGLVPTTCRMSNFVRTHLDSVHLNHARRCMYAHANPYSVGKPGSKLAQFERETWPELQRLASKVPDAGVHFQGQVVLLIEMISIVIHMFADAIIYNRDKDAGSATGDWFCELTKADPWYKDVVPNVCLCLSVFVVFCPILTHVLSSGSCQRTNCQKVPTLAPASHLFVSIRPCTCLGSLDDASVTVLL